jgi:ribosomal protein L16 Arg81 hydroxylase
MAAVDFESTALAERALTHDWKRWVAENKMLGCDDQRIIDELVRNGADPHAAEEEVAAIEANPYFQAGCWMTHRMRKLESLLEAYGQLQGLRAAARFAAVERRSNLPREEFLERYYAANHPVVVTGMMDNWKARTLWTAEYFTSTCGGETIEVMAGRDADARYEINSEAHKTTMLFSEYIERITREGAGNDCYLVANNNLLRRKSMRRLLGDIEMFPEYLDPEQADGGVFFWFGPAATVTPLHHDTMNVLLAQVSGRKRVTLIPSWQIQHVYNDIGVYSEVDCEDPDCAKFPAFESAQVRNLVLEPGEALFIPVGWWHHVRALDLSVSVSFTNFLFPNHYGWNQPYIQRNAEW